MMDDPRPYDQDAIADALPPEAQPRDDSGRFASPDVDPWGRTIERIGWPD